MSQHSNDCKGITYVSNDYGQILFARRELQGGDFLVTGTIVVPGWSHDPDGPTEFDPSKINESTGAVSP